MRAILATRDIALLVCALLHFDDLVCLAQTSKAARDFILNTPDIWRSRALSIGDSRSFIIQRAYYLLNTMRVYFFLGAELRYMEEMAPFMRKAHDAGTLICIHAFLSSKNAAICAYERYTDTIHINICWKCGHYFCNSAPSRFPMQDLGLRVIEKGIISYFTDFTCNYCRLIACHLYGICQTACYLDNNTNLKCSECYTDNPLNAYNHALSQKYATMRPRQRSDTAAVITKRAYLASNIAFVFIAIAACIYLQLKK